MIRSKRSTDEMRADDAIDAYLAQQFGVGLERVLLDGVEGRVTAAVAGVVRFDVKPSSRWPHSDGGVTEYFEGTMELQGVRYVFRCETWSVPTAFVHRFLTNVNAFDPVDWTARAQVSEGA